LFYWNKEDVACVEAKDAKKMKGAITNEKGILPRQTRARAKDLKGDCIRPKRKRRKDRSACRQKNGGT